MSRTQWALSLLLLWHLTAMSLGALPSPEKLHAIGEPRHPTDDPIAVHLTPVLDETAARLANDLRRFAAFVEPVQRVATVYLRTLGLSQNWSMFWDPPRTDLYVRVRYYVANSTAAPPSWMATELVYPSTREDRFRLFYRAQHRDKAIFSLVVNFARNRAQLGSALDPSLNAGPTDLAPIARYFRQRFERNHLQAGERILRSEVWIAIVANPPRGAALEPAILHARAEALRRYYEAPREQRITPHDLPPTGTTDVEADMVWTLVFLEES